MASEVRQATAEDLGPGGERRRDFLYVATAAFAGAVAWLNLDGNDNSPRQFGRYLLISSSRGFLPANLQGLWNDSNTYVGTSNADVTLPVLGLLTLNSG